MATIDRFVPILHALVILVGVPAVAIVIARAAWMGKPSNWDRSMYWTAYAASMIAAAFLIYYAQQMHANMRSWQYLVQIVVFYIGLGMIGISLGCFVGIFILGRGKTPGRSDE